MSSSTILPDIIQTHILTKLDGQTLASASCTSSELHSFCSDDKLWSNICSSNWPSVVDPRVQNVAVGFPSGHRSFFSNSFPFPSHHLKRHRSSSGRITKLISAVDLHYGEKLVFSKVESTDTEFTDWFETSPFGIDLLEPKQIVPLKFELDETLLKEDLSLSWILIDPTRKRSVNLSSIKPVSVQRNWLTQDVLVRYSLVMNGSELFGSGSRSCVNCNIEVTCGMKGSGELHVSRVSLRLQDLDGKSLSGKESLVILQDVMEAERRVKRNIEEERERYEEYVCMKGERKEREERRERRLDMVCIGIATGITIFVAFWASNLFS